MKKLTSLLLAALGIVAFVSCNNPKPVDAPVPPTPKPPVEVELNNQISYQGDTIDMRSIVVDDTYIKGSIMVIASADQGLTTVEKMLETNDNQEYIHKPVLIILSADSFNSELDVMDPEANAFNISNRSELCDAIEMVTNTSTEGVKSGMLKIALSGEELLIDFSLTPVASDDQFECNIKTTYKPTPAPTTNILTLDGAVSAVKSKFYKVGAYETALYLTPSTISSPVDLRNVNTYYVSLKMSSWIENNTKVNIEQIDEDFTFEYYHPLTEESITIKYGELDGATGWFQVNKKEDGAYSIDFDLTKGDRSFKCQFDGIFTKYEIPNQYIVDNSTTMPIKSVVIDKTAGSNGHIDIYLSHIENLTTVAQMKASGDPVTLVFNENYIGMGIMGFSVTDDISIIYKDMTYNNANDKAGNIKGDNVDLNIKLEFNIFSLNAGDLSMTGYYEGPYVTIE